MFFIEAQDLIIKKARNRDRGTKVAHNTWLKFVYVAIGDEWMKGIGLKFHETFIVVWVEGAVIIQHGGWPTKTTAERINEYSPWWVDPVAWKWDRKSKGGPWASHASSRLEFPNNIVRYTPPKFTWCRLCMGKDPVCPRCHGHNQVQIGLKPIYEQFDFPLMFGYGTRKKVNPLIREYNWYDFKPERTLSELNNVLEEK